MLSKIKSIGLKGIDGFAVEVECDITNGMPSYEMVGQPDTVTKESRERVRSAVKNSGLNYPMMRITVNFAPADIKKEGALYDLPVALGILAATEQISADAADGYAVLGELSLNGETKSLNGLLPLLIAGKGLGIKKFIVPKANEKEAGFIDGADVYAAPSLAGAAAHLRGSAPLAPVPKTDWRSRPGERAAQCDFSDVKGQLVGKRALEIAVSGGHNVLMMGPPGTGKTMLAKCVPSIMPDLTFAEALEITKIHSVAGVLDPAEGVIYTRPFRTPHHTATRIALTGGGKNSKPGEISLAHNGVLFLDEMPEYGRFTLETLRQPLEDGVITIARANQTVEYPANFMLVASMNPCPCGNYGSKTVECSCSPAQIYKYMSKLSGPLIDRIDLQVEVDNMTYDELKTGKKAESSEEVKKRVNAARDLQRKRFAGTSVYENAKMTPRMLAEFCALTPECDAVLKRAFDKLKLSMRAYTRILKVARTIADLAGEENISVAHISEAIQFRTLDRKMRK